MAIADKTIDSRLLQSAREEFLQVGFEKASLKRICGKAGVTTGALYKRYKGKDDLFGAVVKETVEDFSRLVQSMTDVDMASLTEEELFMQWDMQNPSMDAWFTYMFQRKEDFYLLTAMSEGSSYAAFIPEILEKSNHAALQSYHELERRGICNHLYSDETIIILMNAYWQPIIECMKRNITWEQAMEVCHGMCRLMTWEKVLGFEIPLETHKKSRASYFQ